MNLEKYTEELLKGYCEKKPSSKKAFSKHLNIVKAYSTNILEDHTAESIKTCNIRESDPFINLEEPNSKTRPEYEHILGDIIELECKLQDDKAEALQPNILELINFANARILEFDKNPVNSVENCTFTVQVLNKNGKIKYNDSALFSLFMTLSEFLRNMIPIRICKSISDVQSIYDTVMHVVSDHDPSYSECKLSEYMFQTAEGNRICLTNNKDKIINTSAFIIDLYERFCLDDTDELYIPQLKVFIDETLYGNTYNAILPLKSTEYFYMKNPGDGDCLFLAAAKYLCLLSNADRHYPNDALLRNIGKDLRFETCKYMFEHRYEVINSMGNIENNADALLWLLGGSRTESNNDKFNSLMKCLALKRNKSIFKNPTNIALGELIRQFKLGELDDFTKYCILMAQYSMQTDYFLLQNSSKLELSCYAGICEFACMALYLKRSIICCCSSKKNADGDFSYNIGLKYSYIQKNQMDENKMPLLLYLRGFSGKKSGSSSDHFELIWPKHKGRPTGIDTPRDMKASQDALFDFHLSQNEQLVPNIETTTPIHITNKPYNMDHYINYIVPSDYTAPCGELILKHWTDMAHKLTKNMDSLQDPHFSDIEKIIFSNSDKIRIGGFLYSTEYLTKFTSLFKKNYATKDEISAIISNIETTTDIDLDKPVDVYKDTSAEAPIPGYRNFSDASPLKALMRKRVISEYTTKYGNLTIDADDDVFLETKDNWVIFGNYAYKKTYISKPLNMSIVTDKMIIKELRRMRFHKQDRPLKVVENWAGDNYSHEYVYTVYGEDDDGELKDAIATGLLKNLGPDGIDTGSPQIFIDGDETPLSQTTTQLHDELPIKGNTNVPPESLVKACNKRTRKDGGLYKVAFRNSLIEYVNGHFAGNAAKIHSETLILKKLKHRSELEEYCKTLHIL